MTVVIGIHYQAEPERLMATLKSVRGATQIDHQLLLLADGPNETARLVLEQFPDVLQSGTDVPRGAPACFNRLTSALAADVFVFLESGSLVSPGWLEALLAALEADPRNGLVGPSTNLAWNEQAAFPHGGGTPLEIRRTAAEAARRFGPATRTLTPLHSLADFCYMVRREVVEAIGNADEGYGLGPCWEMDYNIRAARAGWRGLWVCGAYVYRPPFTHRRADLERQLFEASKHRYQDKFCGARLHGVKTDYRSHCRGDACPNFARIKLIQAKPLIHPAEPVLLRAETAPSGVDVSEPLVSCVMPTYNRREFVGRAIRCFLAQDYPNCELVIVDDGTDPIADLVPNETRIRYLQLGQKMVLGAKRNYACEQARGKFIVHWDDDDFYPTWRVRRQINALLERQVDVCGSSCLFFIDTQSGRAWKYRYVASGPTWVAGSTLAFRRSFWERNRFPDIQVGEDSRWLWSSAPKKVFDLLAAELCIASIHCLNTSRKYTEGPCWRIIPREQVDKLMQSDSPREPAASAVSAAALVSCIMPTWNRRAFVAQALGLFQQQDYPRRELVIVDDGDDPVRDLAEGDPNVRYFRLPQRASIGAKRNFACQQSSGQIIAHWDDDDWYGPARLRYQATPILDGRADITGLENVFTLELPVGNFWRINADSHRRLFAGDVHGGTLVYRRDLLAHGLRYPDVNLAEDAALLQSALRQGKRLLRLENHGLFVYVRHGRNAWRQFLPGQFPTPAGWQQSSAPPEFPADALESYRVAVGG